MITLDTNILVRYLVQDDDFQSPLARQYIEEHCGEGSRGLVTITAFIETYWVLTKVYGFPEAFVRQGLGKLLGARQLVVENDQAVARALGIAHPDLADALIHETGKSVGASKTVTFDKKFARVAGVELLA